jgi:hypothetical protein
MYSSTLPSTSALDGWAPGPVWTGVENLASTGIRSPDRPARSEVAIPTELSRLRITQIRNIKINLGMLYLLHLMIFFVNFEGRCEQVQCKMDLGHSKCGGCWYTIRSSTLPTHYTFYTTFLCSGTTR